MNINKLSATTAGLISLIAIAFQPAQAVLVQAGGFKDNDCSGFFGSGFGACEVFITDDGVTYKLSTVIAKYDMNGDGDTVVKTEINTALYPTVSGNEFSFTPASSGTWTYNQGSDDPGVKYWAAKAGNDFNLFWDVTDPTSAGCDTNETGQINYNLSCLQAANVVTTGTWSTPGGKGLSHLTFYDTEPVSTTNGGGGEENPEPGIMALFGAGLLGMFLARRRYNR